MSPVAGAGSLPCPRWLWRGVDTPVGAGFLGVVFLVVVIAMARFASIAYAVPVGTAGMLALESRRPVAGVASWSPLGVRGALSQSRRAFAAASG